jgi:hypothetical protein
MNTTGSENTFIGFQAGQSNVTGDFNTYIGAFTDNFSANDADFNTYVGHDAGLSTTTGNENSILGAEAGEDITSGSDNVLIGFFAANNITIGGRNAIMGWSAAETILNGSENLICGFRAGQFITSGAFNSYVGPNAGRYQNGQFCTFLGTNAGWDGTTTVFTLTNAAGIGSNSIPLFDNDMILGDNAVEVGIGLSNDALGPQNKLEINFSVPNDYTAVNGFGGTGFSGLRFRDLTSLSIPYTTNPGTGVLAVDANGDVIYVPASFFGANCAAAAPAGNILFDTKVGLNDFSIYFEDGASATTPGMNRLSVGYLCTDVLPAKVSVDNISEDIGLHAITRNVTPVSGFAEGIVGESVSNNGVNVGVRAYAAGSSTANIGMISEADNTVTIAVTNSGGRFAGDNASVSNFGIGASATSTTSSSNYGVYGTAIGGDYAYGIYGDASGGAVESWSGFFVGPISASATPFPSDAMIKEDIVTILADSAEFYINLFNPVSFVFKTDEYDYLNLSEGHQYGLIAQEVAAVTPALVGSATYPASYDSAGVLISPETTVMTLDYDEFIPILIADAKAKNEVIDSLTEKIDNMQEQMNYFASCMETLCGSESSMAPESGAGNGGNSQEVKLSDAQNIVLDQNVPNPFAERTVISYYLPENIKSAQMLFHNEQGKLINTVEVSSRGSGQLNVYGADLSSGIYTYTLVADGNIIDTKRMIKTESAR